MNSLNVFMEMVNVILNFCNGALKNAAFNGRWVKFAPSLWSMTRFCQLSVHSQT